MRDGLRGVATCPIRREAEQLRLHARIARTQEPDFVESRSIHLDMTSSTEERATRSAKAVMPCYDRGFPRNPDWVVGRLTRARCRTTPVMCARV